MPQHGTNGFDPKQLNGYLSEIDVNDIEIERLKEDCKRECEPYRERIKDIIKAAKDAGINMAAFKVVLAEHRAEKRIDRRIAALDMADRADYEAMVDALGLLADTPLGEAALRRALNRRKRSKSAGPSADGAPCCSTVHIAGRAPLREHRADLLRHPALCGARAAQGRALPHRIWEPACGTGNIVEVLRAAGHEVVATDLNDRGCPDSIDRIDFLFPIAFRLSTRSSPIPPMPWPKSSSPPRSNARRW